MGVRLTPCENKMFSLAQQSAALRAFLAGPTIFRWFDRQITQGQIQVGPCVSLLRVSALYQYAQPGLLATEAILFQIDCLSLTDPEVAKQLAFAVSQWLGTVSFMSNAQFTSPPTTPPNFPNFKISQRSGLKEVLGTPVWVESLDYRIWNNANF